MSIANLLEDEEIVEVINERSSINSSFVLEPGKG
jgi:hypothetical protein